MNEELEDMMIAEEYDRKYKNGEVELVDFDEFVKDRKEKYDQVNKKNNINDKINGN